MVIEAKFFTDPSEEELTEQVNLQREAIKKVKPHTLYKDWEIKFAVLTVIRTPQIIPTGQTIILTWDEIITMMETNGPNSEDLNYCKIVIQKAKDRAINESARLVNYEKLKFEDLLAKLPQLHYLCTLRTEYSQLGRDLLDR